MARKHGRTPFKWYTMDLHIHTPASSDYQQDGVEYIDILKQAESRGLDMIAFTDHNTVAGYRRLMEEIDQLELLEKLRKEMRDNNRRTIQAIIGATLLIGGFIVIGVNNSVLDPKGFSILSWILGVTGIAFLLLAFTRK